MKNLQNWPKIFLSFALYQPNCKEICVIRTHAALIYKIESEVSNLLDRAVRRVKRSESDKSIGLQPPKVCGKIIQKHSCNTKETSAGYL